MSWIFFEIIFTNVILLVIFNKFQSNDSVSFTNSSIHFKNIPQQSYRKSKNESTLTSNYIAEWALKFPMEDRSLILLLVSDQVLRDKFFFSA